MAVEVAPADDGMQITIAMTVEFVGGVTGWLTSQLTRGVLARNMEAWLQQLRHRIECGPWPGLRRVSVGRGATVIHNLRSPVRCDGACR